MLAAFLILAADEGMDDALIGCGMFSSCSQNGRDWRSPKPRYTGEYVMTFFKLDFQVECFLFWLLKFVWGDDHNCWQVGDSELFEVKTIQRMEMVVLNALNFRMQAITPFSFLDYFLKKINGDQSSSGPSIARATQLILGTFEGPIHLYFREQDFKNG